MSYYCSACGQPLRDIFHKCENPDYKIGFEVISGTITKVSPNYGINE